MTSQQPAQPLTNEQMKLMLENAFLPHKTGVEIWDYGYRIKFQVRSVKDGSVLYDMPELLTNDLRSKKDFEAFISDAKQSTNRI